MASRTAGPDPGENEYRLGNNTPASLTGLSGVGSRGDMTFLPGEKNITRSRIEAPISVSCVVQQTRDEGPLG